MQAAPAFTSKPGKLTLEAEEKLLIHFGLQDTLTREEAQALAAQVRPWLSRHILCSNSVETSSRHMLTLIYSL